MRKGLDPSQTTVPPRVGNIRELNINQLRRVYRRAMKRGALADRRAARAKTSEGRQRFLYERHQCRVIALRVKAECDLRGISVNVVLRPKTKAVDTIERREEIVFALLPVRLSVFENGYWHDTGRRAWLKRVKKVTTSEGVFYCAL